MDYDLSGNIHYKESGSVPYTVYVTRAVYFLEPDHDPDPCYHCPNNPQNGGSGICACTLGNKTIY